MIHNDLHMMPPRTSFALDHAGHQERMDRKYRYERHIFDLSRRFFVVIPAALSAREVDRLREAIDALGRPPAADVWLPLQPDVEALPRSTHPILLVGRLAPGASVSSAQAELTRLSALIDPAGEMLKPSEIAHRLQRTPGSTKDYLSWLEDVDLVVARQGGPAGEVTGSTSTGDPQLLQNKRAASA